MNIGAEMRLKRSYSLILLIGALAALALAAPGTNIEENRKLLRDWQASQPEEYARVRRNYDRWRTLPESQVERIRALDRDLHQDAQIQEKLSRVLEEYSQWLTRLPAADRDRIYLATTMDQRLRIIREIKDRQWYQRLPAAHHTQYDAAKSEPERQELLRKWRQQEREFQERWSESQLFFGGAPNKRPMTPLMQEEFRQELSDFVRLRLYPMLDAVERTRLDVSAQEYEQRGNLMPWMRAVAELCDKYPVLTLQPRHTTFQSLPPEYQRVMEKVPKFAQRGLNEGRPQYAAQVTQLLRSFKLQPKQQLGPTTANEISLRVSAFVNKTLMNSLSAQERARLREAEGKWPDYPQVLHELARAHRMSVPELSPPGDPRMWDFLKQRPIIPAGPRKNP